MTLMIQAAATKQQPFEIGAIAGGIIGGTAGQAAPKKERRRVTACRA